METNSTSASLSEQTIIFTCYFDLRRCSDANTKSTFILFRLSRDAEWETCLPVTDFDWKEIAEPVMKLYTETTDGSAIETKESALVWNYQYADPDFGSCQAKELLDHLESVLANEPVSVKSGQHIVEVKPQVSRSLLPL